MSFLDNIEQIIYLYPLVAFGSVFLAGVLSSASPCVLETIPLVVGFVGGYSDGDRTKAFRYSLVFIIGLSLTFTTFGAAAGLMGTMFGTLAGPWYLLAGAIALVMGGQLMGLYEIHLPIKREFKPKRGGIVGAFLLGLLFGVVSSPCASPVLVVLLTLVAAKGQGTLWYRSSLLLRHKPLPADALCRNFHRFRRGVCKSARSTKLLPLGKTCQRISGGAGRGVVYIAGDLNLTVPDCSVTHHYLCLSS